MVTNTASKYVVEHDVSKMRQRQLLRQELTVPQILRECGKKFRQIKGRYSDGDNGRCAIGAIMSYHGWNGKDDSQACGKLIGTLVTLNYAGIDKNLIIRLNDSGATFNEIADHLDNITRTNIC